MVVQDVLLQPYRKEQSLSTGYGYVRRGLTNLFLSREPEGGGSERVALGEPMRHCFRTYLWPFPLSVAVLSSDEGSNITHTTFCMNSDCNGE